MTVKPTRGSASALGLVQPQLPRRRRELGMVVQLPSYQSHQAARMHERHRQRV